jgi:hypothetical protein
VLGRPTTVLLIAAIVSAGCLAQPASRSDENESEIRAAGSELQTALSGHAVDPTPILGTFDAEPGEPPPVARFIFMKDGSALSCAPGASCRPLDPASPRRPFELHAAKNASGQTGQYLILRTSATDATLLHVYAVEHAGAQDALRFRELTQPSPAMTMIHRTCSETMYVENDADHACAYYECRLDKAPAPADRCSYLSDFGLPYCKKYFLVDFDDRSFGPRVRQCLQEAIRDRMDGLSCSALESAAIRSHVDCYVASGYCALGFSDRLRIARAIEPKDLSLDIGKTLANIERACSGLPNKDD